MPSKGLSTGSFNPAGAHFAVTTSSYSDGKLSSRTRRKRLKRMAGSSAGRHHPLQDAAPDRTGGYVCQVHHHRPLHRCHPAAPCSIIWNIIPFCFNWEAKGPADVEITDYH